MEMANQQIKQREQNEAKNKQNDDEPQLVETEEEQMMRQYFPTSFGATKPAPSTASIHTKTQKMEIIQNNEPIDTKPNIDSDDEDDEHSDSEDEIGPRPPTTTTNTISQYNFPITHEVSMKGHEKAISALCFDRSGARILSGSYDYTVKMWDFGGMNVNMQSFRSLEPHEGHQVRHVEYSISGDSFLAVTGSAQPKIYTRDGIEICQFPRGDMYIMDQKQTKGHTNMATNGHWHPNDRNKCITSSIDGTIRLWDINNVTKNLEVVKLRGAPRGIGISACTFTHDGKLIAGAATDGSIHLYKVGTKLTDDKILKNAHQNGSETSCLTFLSDNVTLISRGGDHTVKLFDIRSFRAPTFTYENLNNDYSMTDVILSPDEKYIVTGTSSQFVGDKGTLVFMNRTENKIISNIPMSDKSVIRCCWHPILNQIAVGCSDAIIRLLYSPSLSTKGALLCVGKHARQKEIADTIEYTGDIITPHSLPLFRESKNRKRMREKTLADPKQAKIPELPSKSKIIFYVVYYVFIFVLIY
jgi:WD40 repeat protein